MGPQPLLERPHQVPVAARHQPRRELYDADPRAERAEDAGQLKPDDAAADDQQPRSPAVELERAGRVDDARVVRRARHAQRLGAGRDDALLEADDAPAALADHGDPVRCDEARLAAHDLDLALLGERAEARRQPADDAVLPGPQPVEVDLRRAEHDAKARHRVGIVDDFGRMQQCLRRDAADVEAHSTERRPALDEPDLEAEVRGPERRGIAARTCTEHDQWEEHVGGRFVTGRGAGSHGHRLGAATRRCRRRRDGRRRGGDRHRGQRLAGHDQRQHRALGDSVADLDAQLAHYARERRRHVHRRLVALEGDQCVVLGDRLADRDQHLDDRHVLEVAERGNAHLAHGPGRLAHGTTASSSARTSASVAASAVVKRAASAPSMTR